MSLTLCCPKRPSEKKVGSRSNRMTLTHKWKMGTYSNIAIIYRNRKSCRSPKNLCHRFGIKALLYRRLTKFSACFDLTARFEITLPPPPICDQNLDFLLQKFPRKFSIYSYIQLYFVSNVSSQNETFFSEKPKFWSKIGAIISKRAVKSKQAEISVISCITKPLYRNSHIQVFYIRYVFSKTAKFLS